MALITNRQGEADITKAKLWPAERRAMDGEAGTRAKQDCAAKGPIWTHEVRFCVAKVEAIDG